MIHFKTPDESGWYWVREDNDQEDGCMAYLRVEDADAKVSLFYPEHDTDNRIVSYENANW
jgi:hypothetical protein